MNKNNRDLILSVLRNLECFELYWLQNPANNEKIIYEEFPEFDEFDIKHIRKLSDMVLRERNLTSLQKLLKIDQDICSVIWNFAYAQQTLSNGLSFIVCTSFFDSHDQFSSSR